MRKAALLTVKDVQAEYRQSHVGVFRHINAGHFEAIKMGRRTLITRESVERYLASLPRVGQKAVA